MLLLGACPKTDDGSGGGADGSGSGAMGPGNAGSTAVDVGCQSDQACGTGEICDLDTGECVPGFDCSQNPGICQFCGEALEDNDCGLGNAEAYCDEEAGVCRRTAGTCDPCSIDEQCGALGVNNLPNKCVEGYCAQGCGACAAGFQCTAGACIPTAGIEVCETAIRCSEDLQCPDGQRCSDYGICLPLCTTDADCSAGEICWQDAGPLQGQCVDGCQTGETRTSNGVSEVCHGNGRFDVPCDTPGFVCPEGTECNAEGICELTGCQTDADCPLVRTYCDTTTGECVPGCNSDDDCGAFEICEEGECKQQGCRGKDVSCNIGEWCCGHDLYDDASSCPAGVDEGSCFLTPDPWCRTCNDDNDCADIDAFGQAAYCYELQGQDENGNDISYGKFCSVGCETNADCPRGLPCVQELPTPTEGVTTKGCLASICAPISEARSSNP
ncbi:MAG: hypothetical protein CMH56_02070 [Myxococcales bacterium]|nr:hypothetical protein [Myxococcales bacterium]